MGKIKGQTDYEKYLKGMKLGMKASILANCYMCNGMDESNQSDCLGSKTCALYPYGIWGRKLRKRVK